MATNSDNRYPFRKPKEPDWEREYESKLPVGLKAAGYFIQEYFWDMGVGFPVFRWLQTELCYPAFQHLSFAYKGNIYSVLFEFVDEMGNHIFLRDIKNQLRECEENDLVACIIPLSYETFKPLIFGNHLIYTETRKPVIIEERTGNIKLSPWEINNFGVSIVKDYLEKENKKILSFCDVLEVEPNIWFEDEHGKRCYVIVNTISSNNPEAVNFQLNQQSLLKLEQYDGYYAEVHIFSEDNSILYRDNIYEIDFKGLKYIENIASKFGVMDKPIYTIREE